MAPPFSCRPLQAREELVRKSYTVHRSNPYAERALLFILATYHEDKPADMFTCAFPVAVFPSVFPEPLLL